MAEFIKIFLVVFLAEIGDKTQIATLLFASEQKVPPLLVFAAAGGALIATTAIAVLLGSQVARWVDMVPLKLIAGTGFIVIGTWTVLQHYEIV